MKTATYSQRLSLTGSARVGSRPAALGRLVLLTALLGLAGASCFAAQTTPNLEVSLEALTRGTGTSVLFVLHNRGDSPVQVLIWNTPLEGFRSRLFDVYCDGHSMAYRGPTVKRNKVGPEDYVVVPPGASKSRTLDLADAYGLVPGNTCRVILHRDLRDVRSLSDSRTLRLRGKPQRYELPSLEVRLVPRRVTAQIEETASFVGCDSDEEDVLRVALSNGHGLADDAETYLLNVPPPTRPMDARYGAWFGAYDANRYTDVASLYGDVATASGSTVTFDCTGRGSCAGIVEECDPGDFAFTCQNSPGSSVWLCDAFWAAPPTGENSQAGTIVHELSHWFGTDDIEYGCEDCLELALNVPVDAVSNADNYEYFAENFGTTCP